MGLGLLVGCPAESAMTSETGSGGSTSGSTTGGDSTGAVTDSGTTGGAADPTTGGSTTEAPAVCGDGVVAAEEICDDGNDVPEDGCDAKCQKTGAIAWTVTYDGASSEDDFASGVAIDKTGRIVVVGSEKNAMNRAQMLVLVLDPDGKELWKKVIPGAAGLDAALRAVVVGDDGTIYVGGFDAVDDVSVDAVVRSFAADGKEGWSFVAPSADPGFAEVGGLALAGGALYSVGQEALADPGARLVARKHALAGGAAAWTATSQAGKAWAFGHGVAVTGSTIVAVGRAGAKQSLTYPLIVRLDDAGKELSAAVDESGDAGAWLDARPIGDAGDVALAGRYSPPGNTFFDFTVSRVAADGTVQWVKYYDRDLLFDQAEGVAVTPDGGVLAGGSVTLTGQLDNVFVQRLSGEGDVLWTSTYNDPDLGLYDGVNGVDCGADFAVVAGFTFVKGQGANVWVRRFGLE